ncbi:MAG TPA: DUF4956 domain-containing protein [Chitinispirillaceae bacterium]|nr:DUF4956 domain-containing protein [Chitinispirillaceae bacterium]
MDKLHTFNEFLISQKGTIDIGSFTVNLVLAALLSFFLYLLYIRFGRSLSNRKEFARNFMIITCTTMFIITVVKISLALSLGLVGALSIVRFRTAIKEPEELSYLFLSIAVGLGLGASQRVVTLVAFVFIVIIILIRGLFSEVSPRANGMLLQLSCSGADSKRVEEIERVLKSNCNRIELRRMDDSSGELSLSYMVGFDSSQRLGLIRDQLKDLIKDISITFMDTSVI